MNLFLPAPTCGCCRCLDDKRLVKMVLETAQLLSTSMYYLGMEKEAPYKITHKNHPVSKWVRESWENYCFTLGYFQAICEEYTSRFGKRHACAKHFRTFRECSRDKNAFPSYFRTAFVNCTPYKHQPVCGAYRKTLNDKWKQDVENGRPPKWTIASRKPEWAEV